MRRIPATRHPHAAAGRIRPALRSGLVGVIACSMVVGSGCLESDTQSPPAGGKPAAKAGPLRKTTQEVLDLETALQAGAQLADAAESRQGLDAVSGAAISSAATIGMLAVEHKMKLFEAEHGRKPATYAEFMERIIEKGGPGAVSLPALPSGRAYAFDPRHKTVVIVALPPGDPPAP